MEIRNYIALLFLGLVLGCNAPKNLVSYKEMAESAGQEGNYREATEAWNNYFNQFPVMNDLDGALFARAALTAFKAGEYGRAVDWYDQARYRDFASADMYVTLAEIFRKQDNLSRELSALEYLQENFEGEVDSVNVRLFSIYNEIDLVEKAMMAWDGMPEEAKNSVRNLDHYFILNKKSGNEDVCDSLSAVLLERTPDNVHALGWMAKKYYNEAEETYLRQMAEYENNRTRRQYRILLRELEKVTAGLKKSLGYFERLWELNPGDRPEYAGYMSNIYVRFHEEDKAAFYRNLAK
jgi:tetratricopeptide (TPR) repeat protein